MTASIRSFGTLLALAALGACGRGEQAGSTTSDSTARNLTLAAPESTAATGDVAPPAPAAEPSAAAVPATRPPAAQPATAAPRQASARPAAPTSYTLAAGARLHLSATDTITSRTAKNGDSFVATVVEDMTYWWNPVDVLKVRAVRAERWARVKALFATRASAGKLGNHSRGAVLKARETRLEIERRKILARIAARKG